MTACRRKPPMLVLRPNAGRGWRWSLSQRTSAFTLAELLVVMAVIGTLAGLLTLAVGSAKAKAQGVGCLNNLRQLQLGMFLYGSENSDFVVWNWPFWKRSWVYS